MSEPLKAPFPYMGGKSKGASLVWGTLGTDLKNYIEPFAGSLAVLLARPAGFNGPETVNDWSCHLVNAWRAIASDPDGMALACVGVVSEVNTEAQHAWLCRNAERLRSELGDPDFYDLKAAGYYIKGACEWIGDGWASGEGPWQWSKEQGWFKIGDNGTGVNRQIPHLGDNGKGVNRQIPHLGDNGTGEYEQRLDFVMDWFKALQSRLCSVRITCGDWRRVCDSNSVTTKHGLTGIFLDPPYESTEYVYGKGTASISTDVRQWCIEKSSDPLFRIVIAGRNTEHDELLNYGFRRIEWKTRGGYSQGANKKDAASEVLWTNGLKQKNEDLF